MDLKITNNQEVGVAFAKPDPSIFQTSMDPDRDDASVPLHVKHPIFERVEYPESGGIYAYFKGMPYPRKGFPTPDAITANDIVKRSLRLLLTAFGHVSMILPAIAFSVQPWSLKIRGVNKISKEWSRNAKLIFGPYYLKPERMTTATRELMRVIIKFMEELGIYQGYITDTARAIATIFEYDDAYRYRLEDLMSIPELDHLRSDPQKFINLLAKTYFAREKTSSVKWTSRNIFRILKIILRHPKVKRAWKAAWLDANFTLLGMDDADHYHSLTWNQYDFDGLTHMQRLDIFLAYHPNGNTPPLVEIIQKVRK